MEEFIEKRRYPRVSLTGSVEVSKNEHKFFGLLKNVSLGGIAIELTEKLLEGETYIFIFVLPTAKKIRATGSVRWFVPKNGIKLYGIEFNKIGFLSRIRLSSFIRAMLGSNLEKVTSLTQ
ncbi:MAG: PilZ domain-containing protein [Elusimicrobiota bacterium]